MKQVLEKEQLHKLKKAYDCQHRALSEAITQDQGRGSIFANIQQINSVIS